MNINGITTKTTAISLILAAGMLAGLAQASALDEPNQTPTMASAVTTDPGSAAKTQEETSQSSAVSKVQDDVDDQTEDTASKIRQRAHEDGVVALNETEKAIRALDNNDPMSALDSIELAIGKFETVLATSPSMSFVPLGATEKTTDLLASKKVIQGEIKQVKRLIDQNQIQAARKLMDTLASETVITETTLPLATFPDALREAARLIRSEKNTQAKELLIETMNTVVITEHVIPLPIVRAQLMLESADRLAQKHDRSDEESEQLTQLLDDARTQVQIAEILGYGTRSDFKDIYKELDSIKSKTRHHKFGKGFFTKIEKDLKAMRERVFKK